ncbi:MAG: chromosomal replication initiation protein DnaA [Firmicutes bacterium ML8_F2]|jgi:chromosomal replication initiator protein|nr:MAG: chromosomal replication initiation protein DnaA [Firmicutes bacterium ML8_F2]
MDNHLNEIWQLTLQELSKDLNKPSFETWFNLTRPASIENQCLVIEVPNDFTREWFEARYSDQIHRALKEITSENYRVSFIVSSDFQNSDLNQDIATEDINSSLNSHFTARAPINNNTRSTKNISSFNPRYTFDTFVVGSCNRLSHAASQAVAESPSKAYNPLFIYGGVGLGKTHLLHAIGQYALLNHGFNKVFYFSSEKFTNEFINAIRDNKTVEFRNKYRNMDILLIDDIQFLAGKEQTQEEFFHTFNALHDNNKQIVISSDRPPKEIPTLEDRLRSRFEWGLITDLQPPDLETRTAILKKKALSDSIDISDQVIQHIASKVVTNIRELEGALIRIVAYASLSDSPVTMELAEDALHDIIYTRQKNISVSHVIEITAANFGINPEDIQSKKRTQNIALTRQVAMYLCRMLTDLSLPKIGEEFGGRDHTTVLHGFKKIDSLITENSDFKHRVEMIKNDILNNS